MHGHPCLLGICLILALLIFKDGQVVARHVGVMPEARLRAGSPLGLGPLGRLPRLLSDCLDFGPMHSRPTGNVFGGLDLSWAWPASVVKVDPRQRRATP